MKRDFTELFCFTGGFIKNFKSEILPINNCKSRPGPRCKLNKSEVMTIILGYPESGFDCFKNYYEQDILEKYNDDFELVSYKRFNSLMKEYLPYFALILNSLFVNCDGISLVDSTSIAVCKNYRINSHKVFQGFAARGKTTKGWFYGLKMHVINNLQGELVNASFSFGNKDDRKHFAGMTQGIWGKVFGDRGYISKKLFEELLPKNIHLITRLKKNMKNVLMPFTDKILSLKRILIESVFSRIKLLGKFEHSRHRSPINAFIHMIARLINYQLLDDKPSLKSICQIQAN